MPKTSKEHARSPAPKPRVRGKRAWREDNLVTEGPVAVLSTEADRGGLGALGVGHAHGCRSIVAIDHNVVDGLQLGRLRDGLQLASELLHLGVAAALLREYGITVFSEQQLPQLLAWMEQRESDDDSM